MTEGVAIVCTNTLVFAYQQSLLPIERARFNIRHGALPSRMAHAWGILHRGGLPAEAFECALPLITANFLHANLGHLLGNMLLFWIFANVLVPLVGRILFVITYVVGGAIAVAVYVGVNPMSDVAMIGASGPIAALEGAYLTLVLRRKVPNGEVWPFVHWSVRPRGLALLSAITITFDTHAFLSNSPERVAFGAHVGGFLGGVLTAAVVLALSPPPRLRAG